MPESVQNGLVPAVEIARDAILRQAPNRMRYAAFGENNISDTDVERMVQAVPEAISGALGRRVFFFVPLAMSGHREDGRPAGPTLIAPRYTSQLVEEAICHRNVALDGELEGSEGVFISTRLLSDRFALAFELFINVAHGFVDAVGVPESFGELVWNQALADVRGETSQDAWEDRNAALNKGDGEGGVLSIDGKARVDEKARGAYAGSAFSDAVAIYLLSLAVDFDYSELREREYPLLAPQALAERLRGVNKLFAPNPGYEFAIRYRGRA